MTIENCIKAVSDAFADPATRNAREIAIEFTLSRKEWLDLAIMMTYFNRLLHVTHELVDAPSLNEDSLHPEDIDALSRARPLLTAIATDKARRVTT